MVRNAWSRAAVFAAAAGLAFVAQSGAAVRAEWQLVWGDEFTGAKLDNSHWTTQFWWGAPPNGPDCIMLPSAVDQSNGTLKLYGNNVPYQGSPFTCGMIASFQRFQYRYGYAEIRLKLPKAGPGLWVSFWGVNFADIGGHNEIDGLEWLGHAPATANFNLHDPGEGSEAFGDRSSAKTIPAIADGQFHTYGYDWEPTFVKWYVDGKLVFTNGPTATRFIPAAPMSLVVDFKINGDWSKSAGQLVSPSTPFPSTVEVDYIRVYSYAPTGVTLAGPGVGQPLPDTRPVPKAVPLVTFTNAKAVPDEGKPGDPLTLSFTATTSKDMPNVSFGPEHKDYITNGTFNVPWTGLHTASFKAGVPQTITMQTRFPGGPDTVAWDKIHFGFGDADIGAMWMLGINAPVGRGGVANELIRHNPGECQIVGKPCRGH